MATFFMFGRYSVEALHDITTERTEKTVEIIEKFGGKVKDMYVMLGEKDLIFITEFPNVKDVMKASVAVGTLTGISFTTAPALSVEEFDNMVVDM